jgi:putative nucleotidyltransferase with HDIG domain
MRRARVSVSNSIDDISSYVPPFGATGEMAEERPLPSTPSVIGRLTRLVTAHAAALAEPPDPLVGRALASFRVQAVLGAGAMGRVYLAEHALLGRRAAIKVIEPHLAADPDALARFVEEARAVNSIRHPNIVDVSDFGDVDGRPYFVMELLEGETLAARIAKWGYLPPAAAARICAQVASALAAAHERGIVHRDLKPDNIFLCNHPDYPDHVKVLDFGIAKLSARTTARQATVPGMLLGTPLYMSPEQALGETIDHRTDIYALGIVLYEALTGRTPFDRPSIAAILYAHAHDAPAAPRSIEPAIPEAIEQVTLRALAKAPGDRFADMRGMRAAILACTDGAPARVAPLLRPSRLATVAGAAATMPARATRSAPKPGAVIGETLRGIILHRIASNRLVIPSLPNATTQALVALRNPDVNLARVAELLDRDPLIAPQLLKSASSAAYGGTSVPTVHQAVVRLGVVRLRSQLYELSIRRVFASPRQSFAEAFRGMWRHSILVAQLARRICNAAGDPVDAETVHLAGLLHDVGKPLVGAMLLEAERLIGRDFKIDLETWIDIVGQCHREVAVALATKWQLAAELQHAIAHGDRYHDNPHTLATDIVCFANALVEHAGHTVEPVDRDRVESLVSDGAELLGLDWRYVHDLRAAIEEIDAEPAE